jgi:DNA-binding transcriptional MerR regulator
MGDQRRLRPVDVGREFNRSAAWVKLLERQGLIPPAPRDFSGRRFYTPQDLDIIREALQRRHAPEGSAA